jgi:hypothetical protein
MKSNSIIKLIALWGLLATALVAVDAEAADGVFEERLNIDQPITLDVDTGSGSIDVVAGSDGEVFIRGEIRVSRRFGIRPSNWEEMVRQLQEEPPIELSNGRLKVGYIADRSLRKRVSLSFTITAPASSEVIADTGSGSVTVVGMSAPVNADTGSGSVKLEDITGSVVADTGSGSITLTNIDGDVRADAGSGSIRADGVAGAFHGDTGSGSIYLRQTAPGDVVISTGSGSSELNGVVGSVRASAGSGRITVDGTQRGDWELSTGSGSIRVSLPADAAFDLKAKSNSGGIEIDHPLTVEGKISKRQISGQVRGGGSLLEVDTGSGGITIR